MAFWTSLAQQTGKALSRTAKASSELGSSVIKGTDRILMAPGLGKRAVIWAGLGTAGYAAVTGNNLIDQAADNLKAAGTFVLGDERMDTLSDAVDSTRDTLSEAVDDLKGLKDDAADTLSSVKETTSGLSGLLSAIPNFLKNLTGGNAMDMFSNFFSNLTSGKVGGLGVGGLLLGAFLLFGRHSWLAKIGGMLLGMMIIGMNSSRSSPSQQAALASSQPSQPLTMNAQERFAALSQQQADPSQDMSLTMHR